MKTAKLIKTALISGITLAILNSCGGGGGNPLSSFMDKEWKGVETLESSNKQVFELGNLAVNENGNIAVIWSQMDNANNPKIWVRKYNGDSWDTASSDIKPNSNVAEKPTISINDNNEIVATWLKNIGIGVNIPKANTFYNGNWHSVFNMIINNNAASSVKMVAKGQNTVAMWRQKITSHETILCKIHNHNSHNWGFNFAASNSLYDSLSFDVAIYSNSKVVAVWTQKNSSNKYDLYAGLYNINDCSLTGSRLLIDNLSNDVWSPSIASDGNGKSMVVWIQKSSSGHVNVYASKYDGSSWSAPEVIDNSNKTVMPATVKYNKASDEFVVIWPQQNGDNKFVIHSNTYSGGSWQGVHVLEGVLEAKLSISPEIAFDNDGNAVVIWRKRNSSGKFDLVAKSYDGSDWGETKIIDNLADDVEEAHIAFDNDGDAVIVWLQKDSSGHNSIFVNYLE